MRKCSKCKIDKEEDDFSSEKQSFCKKCNSEYQKEWYGKNKQKHILNLKERKRQIRKWFKEYKSILKCSLCPENHSACIEFHHRNKKTSDDRYIAHLVSEGHSKKRILKEIKKCDILCSNCHRKLHWSKR